jgi:hypothetical protein
MNARPVALALACGLLVGACRYLEAGIPDGGAVADAGVGGEAGAEADAGAPDTAPEPADGPADRPPRPDAPPLTIDPPPGVKGAPADIGCADGTREGFPDPAAWVGVAACSGGWSVPGLLDDRARAPQCARGAGNSGPNPQGKGCSVADLCAEGWHVCEGAADLARSSPTDCESAIAPGYAAFFLVRAGASAQGLCNPDPRTANDLHGCGSLGQPETEGCQPLERRLGFSDCQATGGVWACGASGEHLNEANLVVKTGATLGGALCCRDR